MSNCIIVVADAKCARLFALRDSLTPEIESTPRLVETRALVNIAQAAAKAEHRATPISGRNRSGSGGSYAFDDHRAKREHDELRRFSGQVAKAALNETKKEDAHSLVLVAERKTLGLLREIFAGIRTNGLVIRDWGRDLTGDSPSRIHELLAKRDLIPPSIKPAANVRRPGNGLRKPVARTGPE